MSNIQTDALFKIGYGLYVLSTKDGNKDNACIINTFMQLSSGESPIFCVSVSKQNLTHNLIKSSKLFNISVITTGANFDFFKKFGFVSGKDVNKFANCKNIYRSKNGIIYIKRESNAYLSLKVTNTIDTNTHTLFLGELTEAKVLGDTPSVTYEYYHKHIKEKPQNMTTGYICTVCSYILEEAVLPDDFVCPLCKHGASDFEKL